MANSNFIPWEQLFEKTIGVKLSESLVGFQTEAKFNSLEKSIYNSDLTDDVKNKLKEKATFAHLHFRKCDNKIERNPDHIKGVDYLGQFKDILDNNFNKDIDAKFKIYKNSVM